MWASKAIHRSGLTLGQIGQVLAIRDDGHPPCGHVAVLVEQRLDEIARRMAELDATRTKLLALRERLDQLDPAACAEDEICAAFSNPRVARINRGPLVLGQAMG